MEKTFKDSAFQPNLIYFPKVELHAGRFLPPFMCVLGQLDYMFSCFQDPHKQAKKENKQAKNKPRQKKIHNTFSSKFGHTFIYLKC